MIKGGASVRQEERQLAATLSSPVSLGLVLDALVVLHLLAGLHGVLGLRRLQLLVLPGITHTQPSDVRFYTSLTHSHQCLHLPDTQPSVSTSP